MSGAGAAPGAPSCPASGWDGGTGRAVPALPALPGDPQQLPAHSSRGHWLPPVLSDLHLLIAMT